MLKYPEVRRDIILAITIMAKPVLAHKIWIKKKFEEADQSLIYDISNFTEVFGLFFDYISISIKEQAIGWVLYDEQEWNSIQRLMKHMNAVFRRVGCSYAPDEEYLETKEWLDVIIFSKQALKILQANNLKYDFDQ